jgi:hypothetical protein
MPAYKIVIRINDGETIYLDNAPEKKYLEIKRAMIYHKRGFPHGEDIYSFWADDNTLVNVFNITTVTFSLKEKKRKKKEDGTKT